MGIRRCFMYNFVVMALVATLSTWFITALGSATVVFFRKTDLKWLNIMLGFASGVMIAASFWSLLQPAIERAEEVSELPGYIVTTIGFVLGAVFMWCADKAVAFSRRRANNASDEAATRLHRIIMLILSITLHNIPEGLAVGVAFGVLKGDGYTPENLMGAISVAVGIGLQNFPEGAAVSVPLRREGYSRKKSFFLGQASGMVEPIAGVIGALLVVYVETILPYALSFAAGAMILVAVHELIPECQRNQSDRPYSATMGIICGFAVMMLLDVMLG
jgi:ZIP family zinc transporter